jgi:Zn-dependent protease/CBS domain-containing protein
MRSGLRIGRIFGIDITVDFSWVFIFLLVTWNLAVVFSHWHADWGAGTSLLLAVVASLLFFASVLVHELAHSLVAKAQGIDVRNITLFMFGGVSNFEREPTSPRVEFLSAIVGPLTSLVLGLLFIVLAGVTAGRVGSEDLARPQEVITRLGPVPTLLMWLGPINVVLAIFNMIPGFPLDGGRVLRSILWAGMKDLRQATRWATRIGQGIAWLFILTGAAMALGARVPFFGTGLIGGLWLAFIGWFLNGAATQSYRQVVIQSLLEGVTVGQLMRTRGPWVSSDTTLGRLVHDWLMATEVRTVPVIDDEHFVGLVTLEQVQRVPRAEWNVVPVSRVMTPAARLEPIAPRAAMTEVLPKLGPAERELPVVEEGRLVGLLYARDVVRWLEIQQGAERMSVWREPVKH